MGPDRGCSGTGCFLAPPPAPPPSAQAPRFPRHSAGLELRLTAVPGCADEFWPAPSLTFSCLNDEVGAAGQTASLIWSDRALANFSVKEALPILTMNFPTQLCKGPMPFSQSPWLRV